MQLYKGEDSFVHYLIDLALYLLEYEYDWSQSGLEQPRNTTGGGVTTGGGITTGGGVTTGSGKTDPGKGPRVVSIQSSAGNSKPLRRTCPYCGTVVGDAYECPACHNLTR